MDLKRYFSFFFFYYFLIKNKAKKYDLSMNYHTGIVILMTPVVFMIVHIILGLALLSWVFTAFMFVHVVLIPLNMVIVYNVSKTGRDLQRKIKEKERETQRMQEEESRRQREKVFREWQRRAEEQDRQKREREKQKYERQQKRQERKQYNNGSNFNHTKSYLEQCFEILGINGITNDTKEIKKAYRSAAKHHHPDAGGDSKMFIKVKNSYDYILKNIS